MTARAVRSPLALALASTLALLALAAAPAPAAQKSGPAEKDAGYAVDPALFQGMKWRNVGPFRGGRVTAVTGVAGEPYTYYFGATGGGVWKTTDGGISWQNVSDGFFATGTVGALAVAPSDPNVVYAGMGEAPVRGVTTSHGDGVYRSTDAGRTWKHLGLEATEHVSAVAVHPRDPDLVYVAAQGSAWRPNPQRGVYRSRDGGATWELVLHVSDDAGASALSMDPGNPRVIYAAFWDHRRMPWQIRSGGPGSGVWKSADGGDTWERMPQGGKDGLPELMGKVGVAVSPARPDRVWAMVEADEGGLFRSDDAGKTWRRVNEERVLRARAWYYTHVFADPVAPDTVYVLNAPFMKSIDGGKTFSRVGTPHGDNHALWLAPEDPRRMINGNDGGANVSINGGETWSTQGNQPTAQFYRVDTDATFPYRIYGGQQDNSTVAIASAARGGIGVSDWYDVGGCESAHVAFDPEHPARIYAGCYQGQISEWNAATRTERNVMAVPFLGLGMDPIEQPYRFNWNAPIEVSPQDPSVLYHGGNKLLRSTDGGHSWSEISPDLTRDEEAKQGPGGAPITNESAGGETYNTIFYVAPSPHDEGTIWVGTDDGLIQLTTDGGATWSDVTPKGVGEAPPGQVNAIEVSPHDPDTAYVAITRYKYGDYRPLAFRTLDAGASWTKIVGGIPEHTWVRVVREDPEVPGLLYAGTETGAYVSFDAGARWQPLELGLPVVPVTDLQVRDGDLVASTQGRAFWVLDDLSPLRELATGASELAEADLELLPPAPAVRVRWGGGFDPDEGGAAEGQNPPPGAVLDYVLSDDLAKQLAPADDTNRPSDADSQPMKRPSSASAGAGDDADPPAPLALTLEIQDTDGNVLRTYSSVPKEDGGGGGGPFGGGGSKPLPVAAGLNRVFWDLFEEGTAEVPEVISFGGSAEIVVAPGIYRVRLAAGEREVTRDLVVKEDPRIETDSAGYAEQLALLAALRAAIGDLSDSVLRVRTVREQVEAEVAHAEDLPDEDARKEIEKAGRDLAKALTDWEESVVQTKATNFQDIINYPNRINAQLGYLFGLVDEAGPPVTSGAKQRTAELAAQWQERKAELQRLLDEDVASFNALIAERGVPAVVVPPAGKHLEKNRPTPSEP
jgi:photosystem II stability/assembly factor-like uncharacterized protein